jgi:nucleoid-associated protein YgaU
MPPPPPVSGLAPAPAAPASPAPEPVPAAADSPGVSTWVVESGDSFWSIAEDVVGPDGKRAVGRYWRALIAANRDRLVDRGNPDLLVPGQELVVPPP